MLITPDRDDLHKIVIVNPKGGSGKTTLATSIAGCYAMRGPAPTLMDCDPQGFSMRWLDKRPDHRPKIHGIAAHEEIVHGCDTSNIDVMPESQNLIVDLPAGVGPDELFDVTYDAGSILIPILPSEIDVFCASRFIAELLLVAQIDRRDSRLAVIANRTRENNRSYQMLMRFLTSLRIPIIAVLRDSQAYVLAVANGVGLHELPAYKIKKDIEQMDLVIKWLDRWRMRRPEPKVPQRFAHALDDTYSLTAADLQHLKSRH